VLQLEVLIWELGTIDALAACAVVVGEVTTLNHEVLDDTVKGAALNATISTWDKLIHSIAG